MQLVASDEEVTIEEIAPAVLNFISSVAAASWIEMRLLSVTRSVLEYL
jgi:hypothetical protein